MTNLVTRMALWWLDRSGLDASRIVRREAGAPLLPEPHSPEEIDLTLHRMADAARRLRLDNLDAELAVMERRPTVGGRP